MPIRVDFVDRTISQIKIVDSESPAIRSGEFNACYKVFEQMKEFYCDTTRVSDRSRYFFVSKSKESMFWETYSLYFYKN